MSQYISTKHSEFITRQEDPFNAGPPLHLLIQSYITPIDLFFVRSHGNVPEVDAADYRLEVQGQAAEALSLSLDDIRGRFEQVTIPATMQCSGNRRQELMAVKEIPEEVGWGPEAIGHIRWTGARLRDVLAAAGVADDRPPGLHVDFLGLDDVEKEQKKFNYGCSIPLKKALGPEVLLAYAMNGQPLEPLHGFPLRVVVPGYIGARSVKWLRRITVKEEPSSNYFQRKSYRLFPPQVNKDNVKWDEGMMLSEMNISSVICLPAEGQSVAPGRVTVQGFAIAGGNRQVARVDLSTDGGQTWIQAEFKDGGDLWSWRFWQVELDLAPGQYQLAARAVDDAANTQPEDPAHLWNFKGYMNNAWNRVNLSVHG